MVLKIRNFSMSSNPHLGGNEIVVNLVIFLSQLSQSLGHFVGTDAIDLLYLGCKAGQCGRALCLQQRNRLGRLAG